MPFPCPPSPDVLYSPRMTDAANETWTVLKLLNWTKEYLARAEVEEVRVAAEMLLARALGCRRIELYARFDYEPTPEQLGGFRGLVKRAADLEPVAYLVGHKEFYSLDIRVTPDVLVPRPETEALVTEAIGHLERLGRPGRVWDVCTGSGCVGVAIASQRPDATVLATDVSAPAIEVAAGNANAHGLADRVRCRVADLLTLGDDCGDLAPFNVITANPPYVAEGDEIGPTVAREPHVALYAGETGLAIIRPLIAGAAEHLAPGGAFLMEFGLGQADDVRELVIAPGQFTEPRILRDHQNIERIVVAVRG
jgi:release factor glutamine methyltransferase